jgi:hypothetical protein
LRVAAANEGKVKDLCHLWWQELNSEAMPPKQMAMREAYATFTRDPRPDSYV